MACFVACQGFVDRFDDRLGMPFSSPPVPVIEPDFAAEMQHQCFQRRGRVEIETHFVQLGFGGGQIRPEAAQVFHQHQRMLLFLEKPDAHEGRKIAVVLVVAQEHLGGRQCRPFGDRVHLDRLGLGIGQLAGIELVPRDVGVHIPAHGFQLFEKFWVKHR